MQTIPKRQKILHLVKGRRVSNAHPILSTDTVLRNLRNGVETSLMLDLNVIADMEAVALGKSTLEETGLDKAISILNTQGLFLIPGFALAETSTSYLASRLAGFETFLKTYCPNCRDAPNSINSNTMKRLENGIAYSYFGDLPEREQFIFAPIYAGMLKMYLLTFDKSRLPSEKFFDLLKFRLT